MECPGGDSPFTARCHTGERVIVGLISDTHGLLRERAVEALTGSDLIIHAGDVGRPEILDRLRAIAPVFAIRGNVDHGAWAEALPETRLVEASGVRIYVLHDVHELGNASGFDVVVSGHSHKPREEWRDSVLFVNPGSAGPRRFQLPIVVAKLDLGVRPWKVEFVELRAG
ncbi:MAG: YfcE family phosphodiesterase [Proteobacteria bacterium]|nr:MAG: YfcE family phosphodiesterase [Pseudomonadota bacterium]